MTHCSMSQSANRYVSRHCRHLDTPPAQSIYYAVLWGSIDQLLPVVLAALGGELCSNPPVDVLKGAGVVKLSVRDRESIQEAVRRFRKLVERSGIKKEMRRKEYYEKPSETRRRARLRAERRTRRMRTPTAL